MLALAMISAAAVSAAPQLQAQLATRGSPHLKIMSYYGFNPPLMAGWVNMGLESSLPSKLAAWAKYKIPSFYGDLPAADKADCSDNTHAIFHRGKGLCPDWETNFEALAKKDILPNMGKDKALRGVFFGDEICCSNVTCWETALAPASKKARALLGPDAIIYTNECAEKGITEVPPDFDLISVDTYGGYTPGSQGTEEVTKAKSMYNDILFPKLHDHQQVLLVPGTFACSNLTYFPLDGQAKNLVDKLDGYFAWAKQEKRIAGFNPWHFNNRSGAQHGPPCDMELGAVAMPSVYAKLQQIGKFILAGQPDR